MVKKEGRFGPFIACSAYPTCKNTRSLGENGKFASESTGVPCPKDGCSGELVSRRTKRGKVFYGCNRYPDCDYAIWDKPVDRACPKCGAALLGERTTKRDGPHVKCLQKPCGFKEQIAQEDDNM
jgi:DNA topoisomerase-1